MKRFLALIILGINLYATPPCEMPEQNICMYFYKGAMSSEIIIVNLSTDKIFVERASAMLDGTNKTINGLALERGQAFTILKSVYKDPEKKAYYAMDSLTYKILK